MKRRIFLRYSTAAVASLTAVWPQTLPASAGREQAARVMTVTGEVAGDQLGKFLTNTGYYGARQGKFLPQHAYQESADEVATRWVAEWKNGIEGTDIHPGFVKIGVDSGPLTRTLSPKSRCLVRRAKRPSRRQRLSGARGKRTESLEEGTRTGCAEMTSPAMAAA